MSGERGACGRSAPLCERRLVGNRSRNTITQQIVPERCELTGGLSYFLELAERSIDHYPAENLADTLTNFFVAQENKPAALRSILAPERTVALVQTLASREQPLPMSLRAKLLTLLDVLVELGDRRSAALLGSEWFKTARRTEP